MSACLVFAANELSDSEKIQKLSAGINLDKDNFFLLYRRAQLYKLIGDPTNSLRDIRDARNLLYDDYKPHYIKNNYMTLSHDHSQDHAHES